MKWFLTQAAVGQPAIDIREDDEEDLALGFAYLRALAEHEEPTWVDSGSGPGYFRTPTRAE